LGGCGLDSRGSGQGPPVGTCEDGNVPYSSRILVEVTEKLTDV